MGFGRGAGIARSKCLVAALQRRGHLAAVDAWIGFSTQRDRICWAGARR